MNEEILKSYPAISEKIINAVDLETKKFLDYYLWLESAMPNSFFAEVDKDKQLLIAHNLVGFDLQDFFSIINLKTSAIVLCIDSPSSDLRILKHFEYFGIKEYQSYISRKSMPFEGSNDRLRLAIIDFIGAKNKPDDQAVNKDFSNLFNKLENDKIFTDKKEFNEMVQKIGAPFLKSQTIEKQIAAINMYLRATSRDSCQYLVSLDKKWEDKKAATMHSMHITLAWRNTPKHNFLLKLAKVINRHNLSLQRLNASYTDSSKSDSILVMAICLHGSNGRPVWEEAEISDLLRELVTIKYYDTGDLIEEKLVNTHLISGNMGNFLRCSIEFIHQALSQIDSNLYTTENIEFDLCRHPELTTQVCDCFKFKFDPSCQDISQYEQSKLKFLKDLSQLDTGQEGLDSRRKNVLGQALSFIKNTLKTNFYRINYSAVCFRLDPKYLNEIPFDRSRKFPDIPYAIFYIKGMHFFGFHIRFKDLARGGLRTVYPDQPEHIFAEAKNVFTECYNLAWTQQKKNKDIPEGGAKGIIFIKAIDIISKESQILESEIIRSQVDEEKAILEIENFKKNQKIDLLYQAQRAFIESLLITVNCDENGALRARNIIDYYQKPEYIYLGPDENMHDNMLTWIAMISQKYNYKPKGAFISSKPGVGINHKEFGVTSLGVNVYMHEVLKYIGIDPEKDPFTVKMSGGPDGDVAGNQILNLYKFYPKTAKLLALTDGSGTIYDKNGLDLSILKDLFLKSQAIEHYPPQKLSEGGFLLIKRCKRFPSAYTQETLCYKKIQGKVIEEWLTGSDANHLLRFNVHKAEADIFIPAGGRPKTLNEFNASDFLDDLGIPTARAIVEGANLYLTHGARTFLESKGVLIVKDSSANKGGVICSSFEVLLGLCLDDPTFLQLKKVLVAEILDRVKQCALNESNLLLNTHQVTAEPLTIISDKISQHINKYKYQILDYLETINLSQESKYGLMLSAFLDYCLPTLRSKFSLNLTNSIPDHHKKAIIACYLSSYIVYNKGLSWSPSIVDILPLTLTEVIGADQNKDA